MSFSGRQQPEWQGMLSAAWKAQCRREGLPLSPRCPRRKCAGCPCCSWYEEHLFRATGETSTADCNAGRDYDFAMAHFEILAGAGIKWQLKVHSGDLTRMLHELRADLGEPALREHRVDEAYLLTTMQNGYGTREPWKLDREALIIVLGEVKRHVRRLLKRQKPEIDQPF